MCVPNNVKPVLEGELGLGLGLGLGIMVEPGSFVSMKSKESNPSSSCANPFSTITAVLDLRKSP